MVKQGTPDDEVVGTLFYFILKDIDLADLETWYLQIRDVTQIDVACDYVTSGRHALSQCQRDGCIAAADTEPVTTAGCWSRG